MKKIFRSLICITLIVVMTCSLLGNAAFATYTSPRSNGTTLCGASYATYVKSDRLYKDYINPEYETKVVLALDEVNADLNAVINYASKLGTAIPVEILGIDGLVAWNNGHRNADAVGSKFYYAEPDYAITPVVNGTTTVTETVSDVHFTDVAKSAWYYDAVLWGVSYGVVYGTSATTFSPDQTCTHAQILTLIHRQLGSPAATSTTSPFANVKPSDWYYDAVLWAADNGVITDKGFNPSAPCTRADTVLYLWRAKNSPAAPTAADFTDVDASAAYAKAVDWAVSAGIIYGTSATTFSPATTCTRGQIVTILHRYAGSPEPKASGTQTVGYKYAPDVPDTHDYAEAINYCIENRLFKLDADGKFHPERNLGFDEVSALFNRINGWRYADEDYNWSADPNFGSHGYYDEVIWDDNFGAKQYSYYCTVSATATTFAGFSASDAEPEWYKDYATYHGEIWALRAPKGGATVAWIKAGPTVSDFLYGLNLFQKKIAVKPLSSSELTNCLSITKNTSHYDDYITLGEICQTLYEYGMTYNWNGSCHRPFSYRTYNAAYHG